MVNDRGDKVTIFKKTLKILTISTVVVGIGFLILYITHLIVTRNPSGEGSDIFPQRYECYDLEKGDCMKAVMYRSQSMDVFLSEEDLKNYGDSIFLETYTTLLTKIKEVDQYDAEECWLDFRVFPDSNCIQMLMNVTPSLYPEAKITFDRFESGIYFTIENK